MRAWIPPQVADRLRAETEQFQRELIEAAFTDATCDYWDKELAKIDGGLHLIRAKENATVPGLRPGYWHVIRDCSPAPPSIMPIVGDDGEYVEPTDRLLELLRAGDLQNPRAMADRIERDEREERARERRKQAAHEERVEEIAERVAAVTQTRVSMNTDAPWTQSTNGRRGAKR